MDLGLGLHINFLGNSKDKTCSKNFGKYEINSVDTILWKVVRYLIDRKLLEHYERLETKKGDNFIRILISLQCL